MFHFAFIFHPVRRIFSAFFFPFPSLLLSVWISALKQCLPLLCIAGLQLLVLPRPELNLPRGKLGSNLGHLSGQHLLPWAGRAGGVVGAGEPPSGNVLGSLKVFFPFHLACAVFPLTHPEEQGALGWIIPSARGQLCTVPLPRWGEDVGELLFSAAQGALLKLMCGRVWGFSFHSCPQLSDAPS